MWAKPFPVLLAAGCIAACGMLNGDNSVLPNPPAPPQSYVGQIIVLVPDTMPVGTEAAFGYTALTARGAVAYCQSGWTWNSSDRSVAYIYQHLDSLLLNGRFVLSGGGGLRVKALEEGTTTISVTCDGVIGSKLLTVW